MGICVEGSVINHGVVMFHVENTCLPTGGNFLFKTTIMKKIFHLVDFRKSLIFGARG